MRSLIPHDPFGEMMSLRDTMDRLFDQGFLRPFWWPVARGGGVAIDVYETREAVVVKATVPGVKPEDIDVSIEGNVLALKGEFKEEKEVKKENYVRQERWTGRFTRTVEIPSSVDADKAQAVFESGVLTLTLPKREEVKAKTIKIQTSKP